MGNGEDDAPKTQAEVSPFFMAEMLLTQEIYTAVTKKNPSEFHGVNHPVENVNWFQAMDFCNLLNKAIGLSAICDGEYNLLDSQGKKTTNITDVAGFRLPTEAEWEYAAGSDFSTYAGSEQVDYAAWYDDNNDYETKPVGLKFPNKFGIYDMSGNLWEWCLDWYDGDFYKKTTSINRANIKKEGALRVIRGGSWGINSIDARVAFRDHDLPDGEWSNKGFRLVFSLPCSLPSSSFQTWTLNLRMLFALYYELLYYGTQAKRLFGEVQVRKLKLGFLIKKTGSK